MEQGKTKHESVINYCIEGKKLKRAKENIGNFPIKNSEHFC